MSEGNRLVRKFGNLNLYLDFLTEDPPAITGARTVDDVAASVIPGVNRALACRRMVMVKGHDLYGQLQNCKVAVADIGLLLVLKLNAFGEPEAAVKGFHAEAGMGNTGYASAVTTLRADFSDPNQDGPVRAAEFHSGNAEDRDRVRQDTATVGKILLGI